MIAIFLCWSLQLEADNKAQLLKAFADLNSFQCDFRQETYSAFFDDSFSGGTLAIMRPGKLRMRYREGERKLFIWDGETCYERDDLADTETHTPQVDVQGEPLVRLLLYGSNLDALFLIDHYREGERDVYRFRPRDDDSYELLVEFDDRWLPTSVEVIGKDDEGTRIILSNYKLNPDFSSETFRVPSQKSP